MPTLAALRVALEPDMAALRAGLLEARRNLQGVAAQGNLTERELTAAAKRMANEQARALDQVGREAARSFRQQGTALKAAEAEWTAFARSVEAQSARAYGAVRKEIAATEAAQKKAAADQRAMIGRVAGATGIVVGGGALAGVAAATKAAGDFDTAMRNVNSIALLSEAQFQALTQSVLALTRDPQVLAGPNELAKGLYDVYSSGKSGQEALDILALSAKGASAGMTDTATASRVLLAVLNSGIPGVTSASQAMDILFQEVNLGVNNFEGLANSLGTVLPIAKIAGVSLQEVAAALAALTRRGLSIDEAGTAFMQFISHLVNPGKQGVKILDELGIAHGILGVKAQGVTKILDQMARMTDVQKQRLVEALPEIRSLRAMLTLTDEQGRSYIDMLRGMGQAQEGVGQRAKAQNEQLKGTGAALQKLKQDFETLGITIGNAFIPPLQKAVHWLSRVAEAMSIAPGVPVSFWDVFNRGTTGGTPTARRLRPGEGDVEWVRNAANYGSQYSGFQFKPPGGAGAGDGATDGGKISAATRAMVNAQLEIHRLEAEHTALLSGESKALADLMEKYRLAPPFIQAKVRAQFLENEAIKEKQKLAEQEAKDAAREAQRYSEDLQLLTARLADLKSGGTGTAEAMLQLGREYPRLTQAQREYRLGLAQQIDAQKEANKAADEAAEKVKKLAEEHAKAQAELIKTAQAELGVAAATLSALRGGDTLGILRAEHLGIDDATLGKLSAYQQQLLGIKNVTDIIRAKTSPILDPAAQNVTAALARYAGTGSIEAQTAQGRANQLNQIAGILNQYTAGVGGGQDAAARLGYLKQALGPQMLSTLQQTVGDIDAFFGGIEQPAKQAADAIVKANQANQEAAQAYLAATTSWGAGLARNLSAMDAMIANIQAAAIAALRSSAGSISGRASGGSVFAGGAYIVGERGPELFVPSSSGTVVANGGGGSHVTVNMAIATPDAQSFRYSQSQIMASAGRAIQYHMTRNG